MDSPTSVFIRWQGKPVGPFTLEQLRELIACGSISQATVVSHDACGPWAPLSTLPTHAALFSNERQYHRANTNSSPAIDLNDLIAAANRSPPATTPVRPAPSPISAEHDVYALLQFNHEIEKRHGLFKLTPQFARKSRRNRDYLILLSVVGTLIVAVLVAEAVLAVSVQTLAGGMPDQFWPILGQVLFHSPIFAWGLAMFAFFVSALTWLMFGLMDDY